MMLQLHMSVGDGIGGFVGNQPDVVIGGGAAVVAYTILASSAYRLSKPPPSRSRLEIGTTRLRVREPVPQASLGAFA